MEKNMRDYIIEELEAYNKLVNVFDEDTFANAVLKSFKDCKSYKHYVALIPSDIDEYYTQEEHTHFSKYGYYQQTMENRYDNRFFIPNANMKTAVDIIYNEGMVIDNVESQNLPVPIFVVTLRGVSESNFNIDFGTQYNVKSTLSQNK